MLSATALLCLYLACLAFYQASPRRTSLASVKASVPLQRTVRSGAWSLSALALVLMIVVTGLERGFPIWLGLFMLAGLGSLLISALRPDWHFKSAVGVAALCILFGTVAALEV